LPVTGISTGAGGLGAGGASRGCCSGTDSAGAGAGCAEAAVAYDRQAAAAQAATSARARGKCEMDAGRRSIAGVMSHLRLSSRAVSCAAMTMRPLPYTPQQAFRESSPLQSRRRPFRLSFRLPLSVLDDMRTLRTRTPLPTSVCPRLDDDHRVFRCPTEFSRRAGSVALPLWLFCVLF
jgi:hypothetical protein